MLRDWLALTLDSSRRILAATRSEFGLRLLVRALVFVDLFWIAYFGLARTLYELMIDRRLQDYRELLITTDGGVPELFGYLQTVLLIFLLLRLIRLTRQAIYAPLMLIFVFVVFDDAMQIHETCGRMLVRLLDIESILGLRRNDIGEVLTWAGVGLIVLPWVAFGLSRSDRRHRGNGLALLGSFALLLFCAVGVDQLYSNFSDLFPLSGVLIDMVEDGGEMLAITYGCALALGIHLEQRRAVAPLASQA